MSDEVISQEEIDALKPEEGAGETDGADAGVDGSDVTAEQDTAPVESLEVERSAAHIDVQKGGDTGVETVKFSSLGNASGPGVGSGVELILDVQMQIAVELGRTTMLVKDVLALSPGSVVVLEKHSGEPVEVVVNNKTVARGEVVVIDENFGVRITEIINARERDADAQAA